jgi:hypothetical protein
VNWFAVLKSWRVVTIIATVLNFLSFAAMVTGLSNNGILVSLIVYASSVAVLLLNALFNEGTTP